MAVIGVGTLLACGEHDDVTDMARSIVDPIAQGLRGSGPLASIAEVGTGRQAELMATHIRPPRALAEFIRIAGIAGGVFGIESGGQRLGILIHQHRNVRIAGLGLGKLADVGDRVGVTKLPFTVIGSLRGVRGIDQRVKGGTFLGTGGCGSVGYALELRGSGSRIGHQQIHRILLGERHRRGSGAH